MVLAASRYALLATLLLAAAPAVAQELSDADKAISNTIVVGEGEAPTAWLGAEPHFVMVGEFKDFTFDIHATGAEGLTAKREYRPEGEGLAYIDFEIAFNVTTDGIERTFELEFENADFSKHPVPSTFTIQGEEFPEGLLSNLELAAEWEWVEKSVVVNEEELMHAGELTVTLEEGTPGEDGTAPNGTIGGFVTAIFDGKPIAISFTAPVVEAEIDD